MLGPSRASPASPSWPSGCSPAARGGAGGVARFTAHRRIIGELNWLMLRYPLRIREGDRPRWEQALEEARAYALSRSSA